MEQEISSCSTEDYMGEFRDKELSCSSTNKFSSSSEYSAV